MKLTQSLAWHVVVQKVWHLEFDIDSSDKRQPLHGTGPPQVKTHQCATVKH